MPQRTRVNFVVWILFACFFAAACGNTSVQPPTPSSASKPEATTAGTRGGTLTYRLTSPPSTFNYLLAADEASIVTAFFLMGGRLIEFDHPSQKFRPALAESWTAADDGRTVDIKLRENLMFSDGHTLTSDDVIFTLNGIYDSRTNASGFRDAMLVNGKQIETKRLNDRQFQFIFPEKTAAFENYLENMAVLPKHKLEADFKGGKLGEAWKVTVDPQAVATSGPFTLESATPGERVTLQRNEHYFKTDANGTRLPYLDKIVLEIIPDPNNAMVRLSQGSIDIVDRIRPTDFSALTAEPGQVRAVDAGPGLGTDYIWFNLTPKGDKIKHAWFSNKAFRQSVSVAIDRNSIASNTLQGLATPLYGFVAPANRVWANPNLPKIEYDLDKARQLLIQAGFKVQGTPENPELFDAQNNRVEFTMIVPAEGEPRRLMAAVIQQDLAKLGIKMQVAPIAFQDLTERWSKSFDYDAVLLGLGVSGIEPMSYANFVLSNGPVHQWQPNQKSPATDWEARVDALFAEQAREPDHQKRAAIFNDIQNIIADEVPIIPVAARHIVTAANDRVGNYSPSSIFPYSIWNADEFFVR